MLDNGPLTWLMAKDGFSMLMAAYTMEIGQTTSTTALGFTRMTQVINTRAIGKMNNSTDMELNISQMEMCMRATIILVTRTAMENIFLQMAQSMKVSSI